jgi:hypothetical protein
MSEPRPTLIRYTDLYPAIITPLPDGVPEGVKLRILITDQYLTIGWIYGSGDIRRKDIPLNEGDVGENVTYEGGTVRVYTISRKGACSTCGSGGRMLGWEPFPGVAYIEEPRKQLALQQRVMARSARDGTIPQRYTRR